MYQNIKMLIFFGVKLNKSVKIQRDFNMKMNSEFFVYIFTYVCRQNKKASLMNAFQLIHAAGHIIQQLNNIN